VAFPVPGRASQLRKRRLLPRHFQPPWCYIVLVSGISSISSGSSSSLPNGGLSSVGASLLDTGSAPNPVPAPAAAATPTEPSTYQKQFAALQQYDNQELLYASFLSPSDALANADSVFQQAATLLGSPGHPGTLATQAAAAATPSSTSTASSALTNLPSVQSILDASDQEALQTIQNYVNAPAGSSIIDYQA
jgi:hypothetical protein